jgi:type IV secretory pathway VirJ component
VCAAADKLSHGRFKNVTVYVPQGEVRSVALLLSDTTGWNDEMAGTAQALVADGAMVAGIDLPQLAEAFDKDGANCVFAGGDLENLSRFVQAYYKLPTYFTPILTGRGAGGALAYAVLAQSAPGIFGGAISIAFCPLLPLRKPLCESGSAHFSRRKDGGIDLLPAAKLSQPWITLQGETGIRCDAAAARAFVAKVPQAELLAVPDTGPSPGAGKQWLPQLRAAYMKLTARGTASLPAPPKDLSGLPVVEVPAAAKGDTLAILISGDGGWAGIDKELAAALVSRGVPVAGLDSLRYFWTARSPESTAKDVDRMIRFYVHHWQKKRVLLLGYSQGANVLPFVVNRLSPESRALVALAVMMGLEEKADFEFHVVNWLKSSTTGLAVRPEVERLPSGLGLCIHGADERASLCPKLDAQRVRSAALPGGHHFAGNYDKVAELILAAATSAGR